MLGREGGGVWLGGGVRMDVNEELKLWGKFTKKFGLGWEGGSGGIWGGGGRIGGGGVRVDVNEKLKFL